jgi:hypothetical protein
MSGVTLRRGGVVLRRGCIQAVFPLKPPGRRRAQRTGIIGYPVESRLMFEGTVTATDMSRATDAREKDRLGIFGTGLSYAGSYGRVTSESIGRDLNPLGRGRGQALVGGMQRAGGISPRLPRSHAAGGVGNSVNNGCFDIKYNGSGALPLNAGLPWDLWQDGIHGNYKLSQTEKRCIDDWVIRTSGVLCPACRCLASSLCPRGCTDRGKWIQNPYDCQRAKCVCESQNISSACPGCDHNPDCWPKCACTGSWVVRGGIGIEIGTPSNPGVKPDCRDLRSQVEQALRGNPIDVSGQLTDLMVRCGCVAICNALYHDYPLMFAVCEHCCNRADDEVQPDRDNRFAEAVGCLYERGIL